MAQDDVSEVTSERTEGRVSPGAKSALKSEGGAETAHQLALLDQWFEESKWELIVHHSTELLDGASVNTSVTGELHRRRGEALYKMTRSHEALRDLEVAWDALKRRPELTKLLLQVMRELGQGQRALNAVDESLKIYPGSVELLLAKVDTLRLIGRQDQALEIINCVEPDSAGSFVRLKAALLCDIGDFDGAIECLLPATSPFESAEYVLLAIRGWAHQNSDAPNSASLAEQVYRYALTVHKNDYWSRKGLANALRRLDRIQEARDEYQKVVDYAEELRSQNRLSPYDYCLAGWCYYCLGRFREGADCSSAGLSAFEVGAAAQFDYGLIMLADSAFEAASEQYERSIRDVQDKNYLRRCGLLSIALTDLRDARTRLANVAGAPETYAIEVLLAEALKKALEEFAPGKWEKLKRKVENDIEEVSRDTQSAEARLSKMMAGDVEDIDWERLQVVGFCRESAIGPCALMAPVIRHIELPGKFYRITAGENSSALKSFASKPVEAVAERGIVLFATTYPASPSTRILWVSSEMLDALGSQLFAKEAPKAGWERCFDPAKSLAAIKQLHDAEELLDTWAEQLIAQCVKTLIQDFEISENGASAEALRTASFALAAAQSQEQRRKALEVFGASGGSSSSYKASEAQTKADGSSGEVGLERQIQEFERLLRLRAQTLRDGQGDEFDPSRSSAALKEETLTPAGQFQKSILVRARAIADVVDVGEQDRLAAQASADMQMLVPLTSELEPVRKRLVETLNTQEKVHLDSHESILLMSRAPAFYATSVLVGSERPLVHSITFLRETRRMKQAGMEIPDDTLYIWDQTRTRGGS